jgi:hypothetical protein
MTHLPTWTYQGTVPLNGDLSILESALHSGRVAAAELGYTAEPQTIETEEAMLSHPDGDPETDLLSAEQAVGAGLEFNPTVLRFRMEWASEGDSGAGDSNGHDLGQTSLEDATDG